jgi:hypothetical protein
MRKFRAGFVWVACLGLVAGCTALDDWRRPKTPPAVEPSADPETTLVFGYLATLEALSKASPAEQAELTEQARRAVALEPTTSNRLRHALILALPGHAASNATAARTELGSLLATKERLLPAEAALAAILYQEVNSRLALESENKRLSEEAGRDNQDRVQALNRRLQAQSAENDRLRQQLDEALAKLEAVAALERSLAKREAAPRGAPP